MKTEFANVAIRSLLWYIFWGAKDFEEVNKTYTLKIKPIVCLVLLCSYTYYDIGEICHQKEDIWA